MIQALLRHRANPFQLGLMANVTRIMGLANRAYMLHVSILKYGSCLIVLIKRIASIHLLSYITNGFNRH